MFVLFSHYISRLEKRRQETDCKFLLHREKTGEIGAENKNGKN
jgi:hypothetical protein